MNIHSDNEARPADSDNFLRYARVLEGGQNDGLTGVQQAPDRKQDGDVERRDYQDYLLFIDQLKDLSHSQRN